MKCHTEQLSFTLHNFVLFFINVVLFSNCFIHCAIATRCMHKQQSDMNIVHGHENPLCHAFLLGA